MSAKDKVAAELDSKIWILRDLGVEDDEIRQWVENALEDYEDMSD